MKKILKYILLAFLFFQWSAGTRAQKVLSIEECRSQALSFNKQLKKAVYVQNEAEAQQKAARTAYLPALSAEANLMHMRGMEDINMAGSFLPTAESAEAAQNGQFSGMSDVWMPGISMELDNLSIVYGGLTLSQPIYTGGKITTSNKMADVGVEMASMSYHLKYSEVIELTDQAFWNVAMVEANIELAEKYIEMLTETEELMTSMYEVGLQPASEKLRVNVQKNEAELQLLVVKNNLKIAQMNLKQVLGMNLNAEIRISYDPISDFSLIDLSNGSEMAAGNRNELKLLEKQIQLAELDKKMIQSDYLPQLGLGIQYTGSYVENIREDVEFNPMIAAQLTIPIFQWGQGSKKKQAAQYKIRQNEIEWSRTSDLIDLEVQQTKVRVEEAYEAISIAGKNIVAAEESLAETKSSFEVGMNSTTDLLNAQADWLNARAQQIQAVAQYKVLETTWKRVTGVLNPDTAN